MRLLARAGAIFALVALVFPPMQRFRTATAQTANRPNILFIITDDQRRDGTMSVMPQTRRLFGTAGTEFTNFYDSPPLCCPSRASFWSGRFAHNHGVRTNGDPAGEAAWDQSTAIQAYLKNAGYTTALVGKYWNEWKLGTPPPNYDRYAMFSGGYNDMHWGVNGTVKLIPGYTTDIVGDYATQFLRAFETNDARPWFLYVAPQAPHSPFTPATRYATATVPSWSGNPAVFEADRSDKPQAVRWRSATFDQGNARRIEQLRTLMSVDDMVARIFDTMSSLGESQNTLAIYTSDNGYMWAEHGIIDKRFPYPQSTKLPMFLRWPGHVAAGAKDARLTENIDIEPTLLQAAGIAPAHVIDGVSVLQPGSRNRLFMEYFKSPDSSTPSWATDVTAAYQYTEWYDSYGSITFREYYDVTQDWWLLRNLLHDGTTSNDPSVSALHEQLAADRVCAGATCPRP